MDRILLSSPQLHSLERNVYYKGSYFQPHETGNSELQMLKQYLIQGNSIKNLHLALEKVNQRLSLEHISKLHIEKWEDGPLNFHWQDGDRFPPLEKLRWKAAIELLPTEYVHSSEQCSQWINCMDWNKLKVLDMGPLTTTSHLIEHLIGNAQHLQSL
jgi:hypothetical protein